MFSNVNVANFIYYPLDYFFYLNLQIIIVLGMAMRWV